MGNRPEGQGVLGLFLVLLKPLWGITFWEIGKGSFFGEPERVFSLFGEKLGKYWGRAIKFVQREGNSLKKKGGAPIQGGGIVLGGL